MITTNKKDGGYTMKAQTKMGVSSSEKYPPSNFVFFNLDNFLNEDSLENNMERDHKGRFVKGSKPWCAGTRGKVKAWNKGKKLHYPVWNKGKNGVQKSNKKGKSFEEIYGKEKAEEIRKKIKEARAKQIPSEKQKEAVSKIMKGNDYSKLRKSYAISEEHKEKLRKASLGREKSEEEKQKLREARAKQVLPKNDTSIEIKIQELLTQLNINYQAHKFISEIRHSYQCDIFIPEQEGINKKTIIECDGCYWHGCPDCNKELNKKQKKQRDKDNRRNKELKGQGYRVIRLWEHEIKPMKLKELKEVINDEK